MGLESARSQRLSPHFGLLGKLRSDQCLSDAPAPWSFDTVFNVFACRDGFLLEPGVFEAEAALCRQHHRGVRFQSQVLRAALWRHLSQDLSKDLQISSWARPTGV